MNFFFRFSPRCAGLCLGLAFIGMACPVQAVDKPVLLKAGSVTAVQASPPFSIFGIPQFKASNTISNLGASPTVQNAGSVFKGVQPNQLSSSFFTQNGFIPGPAQPLPVIGPRISQDMSTDDTDLALRFMKDADGLSVTVPWGIRQVRLEAATPNGWKPVDIAHLGGGPQTVHFALPAGVLVENLRAMGGRASKFSPSQLQGETVFAWQEEAQAILFGNTTNNVSFDTLTASSNGVATVNAGISNLTKTATSTVTTAAPEAVESDIWKVIGDRLFFFNQYRGMQVFDLKDPRHPVKTGSVRMAAVGEQFYALDDKGSALALLTRNNTRNTALGISTLQVMTVSADGRPKLVQQLPLNGNVADSRLLGTRLYVLLSSWGSDGLAAISLVGYDLAKPEAPESLGAMKLPSGYYLALQASGPYLMVSSSLSGGWWGQNAELNALSVLDTSDKGNLRLVKTVCTKGYLTDQFKMNISGDILTAVSMAWDPNLGRTTWVENFSLSSLSKEPVGQIKIDKADTEQLHATRFDSGRLYVVTFRQMDPLFIIDLKDPANPAVKGELITPGYSSYIEPHGDRLLAVGIEDWRVCVSWFDVSDVTAPKLLSRVFPGDKGNPTWSEANYDHKAVHWAKEENRIFLPFEQWDNGYYAVTQVVNLVKDGLELGAVIRNKGSARRGDVINDSMVSISGQQMVVTTNPASGEPQEIARLELAWPVDRVVALDKYLVQAEDGNRYGWWGYLATSKEEAVLRLSDKDDPDTVLDSVSLGRGSIVGITRRGASIYVGQIVPPVEGQPQAIMRTWTIGMDGGQKLQRISDASCIIRQDIYWQLEASTAQHAWVTDDILVWQVPAVRRYYYNWWQPINVIAVPISNISLHTSGTIVSGESSSVVAPPLVLAPPQGPLSAMVFPVRVGLPGGLKAGAGVEVHLPVGSYTGTTGRPYADRGFLFFSTEHGYDYNIWGTTAVIQNNVSEFQFASTALASSNVINLLPIYRSPGSGATSSLHVLDFRHGLDPVVRDPVSLAGSLMAVSSVDRNGAYLLVGRTDRYNTDGKYQSALVSLAYDGVRAHRIDVLNTPFWSATCSEGGQVFLASLPGYPASNTSLIKSIRVNELSGLIEPCGTWQLDFQANALKVINRRLLASSWGDLDLAEIRPNGTLVPQAHVELPNTIWFNVDRVTIDPDFSGIWLPTGDYGVDHFGLGTQGFLPN